MGWITGSLFLVLGIVFVVIAIYFVFFVENPSDPCYDKVKGGQKNPGWERPRCLSVSEKISSQSIPQGPSIYLGQFVYSQGAGGAVCTPRWYSTRLVNLNTGEYGPLGKWTLSPVEAGNDSQTLPWAPSATKTNGCNFNQPTMVTIDPIPKGYHVNLHRHLGTTPPTSTNSGKIIGILNILPAGDHRGWTSFALDVGNGPDGSLQCC